MSSSSPSVLGDTTRPIPPGTPPLPLPPESHLGAATATGGATLASRGPDQAPPAERVGRFRVERELGRGGMGVVYEATDEQLARRVALKVLHAGPGTTEEEVERFLIEARAAARLRHPNIVGVHDTGRDGARWFIAMDLVAGESLRARAQRERLAPREAAAIVATIARALHHAHAAGVLHRDVKPHNIFLGADGTPLLGDFGLARLSDQGRVTVTGEVIGTPAYMAPEQALGDPARVDRRSDVWALGVTLWELLAGRPPFVASSVPALLAAVVEDEPPSLRGLRPEVDRDLEAVALRCLEKEPDRRYETAAALADDLERWARREPVAARPRGPIARLAAWGRRRPRLAAALGALVVVGPSLVTLGLVAGHALLTERARLADVEQAEAERQARLQAARQAADDAWAAVAAIDTSRPRAALAGRVGEVTRALDAAGALRALAPGDRGAAQALGRAAWLAGEVGRRAGDWTLAARGYAEAAAVDSAREPAARTARLVTTGLALAIAGRLADGLQTLEHAVASTTWFEPAEALANAALISGQMDRARRAARVALARERCVETLMTRAMTLTTEDPRRALSIMDEAVAEHPGRPDVLVLRAQLRRSTGDTPGALEDLATLCAMPGPPPALVLFRAKLLLEVGRVAEAADLAEGLAAAGEDDADLLLLRGRILLRQGRPQEALAVAERVRARDSEDREAWVLAREALGQLGRTDEAMALPPEGTFDRELTHVARLVQTGHGREAIEAASAALERWPRSGALWSLRGLAWFRVGDAERALADLNTAETRTRSPSADLHRVRGEVHEALGDLVKAAADYRRAMELGRGTPLELEARERLEALPRR